MSKKLFDFIIEATKESSSRKLIQKKNKINVHPAYENYSIKTHDDPDASQPESQINSRASATLSPGSVGSL